MTNDKRKFRKVYVCVPAKASVSKDDVKSLLVEAGIPEEAIVFISEDDKEIVFYRDDDLIIILEDSLDDEKLAECVLKAVQSDVYSIVGVWSPNQEQANIPNATSRYATAQISWDARKLAKALQGTDSAPFETAAGTPATPHKTKPNQC